MINTSKPKYSADDFFKKLQDYETKKLIPHRIGALTKIFFDSYVKALQESGQSVEDSMWLLLDYLDLIKEQVANPFTFEPYHQMIRTPYDHHLFGIAFFKALVNLKKSSVEGLTQLQEIVKHIKAGGNVILFANHQIEADPQALYVLLEIFAPELIPYLIFVAGERVLTDPLAVPFSLGCNLLCIYSKRYIDHPLEKKAIKQHHNHKTMQLMKALLAEGGHCIYVAPSGGRDRPDTNGIVKPAVFDPQSIEMFYLMAKQAAKPTWFYPLTLATYSLLPPPETIQKELGEHRTTKVSPIHAAFGKKIDMDTFPGSELKDKTLRRKAKADYIYHLLCKAYEQFL
ncbi:MAG: 1-acyl-sn-glycerol-3-phosphate acyltransferase [Chlamydiota bacterium]